MSPAPLTWSEISDKFGSTITTHTGTWPELIERLRDVGTFSDKDHCPWFKFATFGNKRTVKNSLRNNENVVVVSGLEADYDGEVMSMEEAAALLKKHNIRAALYPSPSNALVNPPKSYGGPRWRVICPLARSQSPDARKYMMARLNGALGGILADESFVLSQGFYFGDVGTNDYKVIETFDDPTAGQHIDELGDLDKIAIGKRKGETDGAPITENIFAQEVGRLGRLLITGDGRRELLKTYIASRSARGVQADDLRLLVCGLVATYFDPLDPIEAGGVEQIIQHFADKDAQNATKGFSDEVENTSANVQRYKLLSGAALRDLPPLAWRVRGVLPAVGLAALYGPSASGKSFLALDMAAAIAEGQRWFDCRVSVAPVVYVVLEGEAGFKLRAQAWEVHKGRNLPAGLHLVLQPFTLTQPQDVADLAAASPAGAVIVIDTLNRAAPTADENSSKDMGQILEAAKALQAITGGLVVLVHHTGKDASRGLRGHSSLFAAMDAAVEVSRDGDRREWKVAKSKDGQDGHEKGFSLEVVAMGTDDDGEAITSCVVAPAGTPAAQTKPLTLSQRQAMDALTAALADDLFGASVHRDVWREAFYSGCNTENSDARRKAFARAVLELVAQGRVFAESDMFSIPDF